MNDILNKISNLLESKVEYKELQSFLSNTSSVSIDWFVQKRDYFLKIHEIYLKNNNSMGFITYGLEGLINNIKQSEEQNIVINLIRDGGVDVTVYTNETYSTIFGVI